MPPEHFDSTGEFVIIELQDAVVARVFRPE
jgi:hypothetical protein